MIDEHAGRKWASFTVKVDQQQKRGYTGLVCNIPYTWYRMRAKYIWYEYDTSSKDESNYTV